jgi:hypothetical protein
MTIPGSSEFKIGDWVRWIYAALLILIGNTLVVGGVALVAARVQANVLRHGPRPIWIRRGRFHKYCRLPNDLDRMTSLHLDFKGSHARKVDGKAGDDEQYRESHKAP